MAAANPTNSLLDKPEFNDGAVIVSFILLLFYSKVVAFIFHTHTKKRSAYERVPAPAPLQNILNVAIRKNRKIKTCLISKFQLKKQSM